LHLISNAVDAIFRQYEVRTFDQKIVKFTSNITLTF